jgi:hypothetical protein
METQSSGSIRFRYSVVKHTPSLAKTDSKDMAASYTMNSMDNTLSKKTKSIDDILTQFRNSGNFTKRLNDSLSLKDSGSLKEGISKVLGSTGTTNATRVAELLAKARARSAVRNNKDGTTELLSLSESKLGDSISSAIASTMRVGESKASKDYLMSSTNTRDKIQDSFETADDKYDDSEPLLGIETSHYI